MPPRQTMGSLMPKFNTALPGVLMMMGGLLLVYWALSGWGLFGLGQGQGQGQGQGAE